MKKAIAFISLLISSMTMADKPDPTTYPDVKETPPPVVSLRSLNTGEPIRNSHYGERSELNTHWELRDVVYNNRNYVQFRAFDTDKCMTIGTGVKTCDDLAITTLNLIPTDTGAFIITSSFDNICLLSTNFREYDLQQCVRPEQLDKPVEFKFLWTIAPAFGQSKVLKVPVK
ncbi:MAG: toxin [Pasteurellaceae bacterium]|nr:toxin [Pasteurellaceae bacterium]